MKIGYGLAYAMASFTFTKSPFHSLRVLLLVLLYLSSWGTYNSYGMALAATEDNIENLITSSGLTSHEQSLFFKIIEGISTPGQKSWYSDGFGPEVRSSYKDSVDLKEVLKILNLADSSMEVVKMIQERLDAIDAEKRKKMGRWAAKEQKEDVPYRISTTNRNLLFEIEKHDCLKNEGVSLPSNKTTDVPGSVWLEYSDTVYVPFECPKEYDFDLAQALKDLQKLQARTRSKRQVIGGNSQVNIFQVNLTLTNETFDNSLLNVRSDSYIRLTSQLTSAIDGILNSTSGYVRVNDFSFRSGSVIATFHIEFSGSSNNVSTVKQLLQGAIIGGTLGVFSVNSTLLDVGQFIGGNAVYSPWQAWSACTKTCGTGEQVRHRSCNSTAALACAHLGPSVETRTCYLKFCSSECNKVLTGDRGNFTSPVVDGKYPALTECVWQIRVDSNHTVVVEFDDFELERDKRCNYDFVAFYDGDFSQPSLNPGKELMRFCGNTTPPHAYPPYGYPVNSSDSAITVYFKTDSSKQYKGFTVIWYKVLKYHLRVSNLIPQSVTAVTTIYNPWSETKDAAIPVGTATTCSFEQKDEDCYFLGTQIIISRIISVFLNRKMPLDSSDPILITFEHILDEEIFPSAYTGRKTCVTWDHTIPATRFGAWTRRGCYASMSNLTHTICKCIHTGVFAVLGETEVPPKDLYLKANSYFGVAVSLLFVILTVHSLASKGKMTTGELFHLFETLVSGILLVVFLVGAHVPAKKDLCGFLSFFLYYLVLSQFTWMLLTVVWIQNLLKRFLSERVRIKIVYFVLGWGVPIVLAGVAGKVDIDQHGNEDNVCWVSLAGAGTVWGYAAPVFVMLMVNVAIFVFLLLPRAKQNYDCENMRPRVVKEILIMFFFLMAWVMGVKVVLDDSFSNQYFFCIFLILQGVVNYNVCFEKTELFWKEKELNTENEPENDESTEKKQETTPEENNTKEEKVHENSRMTVKTLKNLNIYKENGVFVIEA